MTQERDNFVENLKEVWEPEYRSLINYADPTRALFDTNSDNIIQGKYFKASVEIGNNAGIGFRRELETLPTAGHVTAANHIETLKKMTGRLKLSREVMQDSRTNEAAIASAMERNKRNLKKNLTREVNFILHHRGNGIIAQCGTTTASTTVQLAAGTTVAEMNYLKNVVAAGGTDTGLRVDLGTTANPVSVASSVNVTAVNVAAKQITISGSAVTTSATTFLYRAGQGTGSLDQNVTNSLQTIIDDTTVLHGLDPASVPQWASIVIDANNAPVTEDVFEDAFDQFDINAGSYFGEDAAKIVTTHKVRRELASSMKDRVRYVPTQLKGGFQADLLTLQLGGGPVGLMVDRDTKDNTAYLVTPSSIVRKCDEDWHFETEGGGPVYYDRDTDAFEMVILSRFEYECLDRRLNLRIDALGQA